MRILVTVSPLMYREVIALFVHHRRPDFEVLISPPRPLDGRTGRFGPHVLVHDADEACVPPEVAGDLLCRVRVGAPRADAVVEVGGVVSEVHDAGLGNLFAALEAAERLMPA